MGEWLIFMDQAENDTTCWEAARKRGLSHDGVCDGRWEFRE